MVEVELVALNMHFDNFFILHDPIPFILVSLLIVVELVQEGFYISVLLGGQKASLEFPSEGRIFVDVSLSWCLSDSSDVLWGAGPLLVVFLLAADPLAFFIAVFFTPPILFSVIGFISYSTFFIFQHTGWEVLDVGWLSLS